MHKDLKDLKNLLDEAVLDSRNWSKVCEEIANLFDANNSMLITTAPEKRGPWLTISPNMLPALKEYISEGWQLKDHRQSLTQLAIQKGYATDDDLPETREERAQMPYYQFLSRHNIGFLIGFSVLTPQGYWIAAVYFDENRPEITKEEIELVNRVRPLIEEATAKADQIAHKKILGFANFFQGSKTEIHVLDLHGNECLRFSESGKIVNTETTPDFLNDQITKDIEQGIAEVCSSAPEQSLSLSFIFQKNGKFFQLLAIQVPPPLRHYYMPFKVCLICTEVENSNAHKFEQLRSEYNFLDSEVTTLELLSAGNNVKSISQLLSLKESTIRQRLKHMYDKTSVSGQVELIGLYNRL